MGRTGKLLSSLVLLVAAVLVVQHLARNSQQDPPTGDHARRPDGFPIGVAFADELRRLPEPALDRTLKQVVELGANWIRIDVSWAVVAPSSAQDQRWADLDRVVRAARARDLKVLGILTYTPAWARVPGCADFTCPPRSAEEFASFAQDAATRYRGAVDAFEVWNEPNLPRFWRHPDPAAYGALLAATVPAVRRGDPGARVVLGGLAAMTSGREVLAPPRFLAAACASGACAGVDAVGYHPYTFPLTAADTTPEGTAWQRITQRSSWGAALDQSVGSILGGRGRTWITEYGAPSGGSTGVDETQQAAIVASGIRAARADAAIGAVFIYSWKDLGTGPDPEQHFGLLRADGSRKPSFSAFANAAAP